MVPGETLDEQASYVANQVLRLRTQTEVSEYLASIPKEVKAEVMRQADEFYLDEDA